VKALTYCFDNLINDVESGVRKPAVLERFRAKAA
jgi:hypothetical protein